MIKIILTAIISLSLFACSTNENYSSSNLSNSSTNKTTKNIEKEPTPTRTPPTATPIPTPNPIPIQDLRQMLDLAEDSRDAVDKKYKGKEVRIEGKVRSIIDIGEGREARRVINIIPKFSDAGQVSGARCEYIPSIKANTLEAHFKANKIGEGELLVIGGILDKYSVNLFGGNQFILDDCYIDKQGTTEVKEIESIRQDKISDYFKSIGPLADLYLSEREFPAMYPNRVLSGELLSYERTEEGIQAEIDSQIVHIEKVNIKLESFDDLSSKFKEKINNILTSIEKRGGSTMELENYGVYDFVEINSGDLYILNEIQCISDFEYDYNNLKLGDEVEIFGKFFTHTDDFRIALNDCADSRRYSKKNPSPFSYQFITSEDLISEFDNDPIAATKKYENTHLHVTGIISTVQPGYDLYLWIKNFGSGGYYNNEYGVIGKYKDILFEMNHKGTIETDINITLHLSRLQMEKIIDNYELFEDEAVELALKESNKIPTPTSTPTPIPTICMSKKYC